MSKWTHRISYSPTLEKSHLSDAGLAIDNSHFVVLSQSHSSKFVHLGCGDAPGPLGLHNHSDMSPLCQSNKKKSVLVQGTWASCLLVFHEVGRDSFHNLALHCVWFLLWLIFHLYPPPVGISFSQDQVNWFQWNSISFHIVVPLLSLCLWCGLHLSLFKGLLQSFTQLSDIVVDTLVFLCTPYHGEIEVDG